MARRIARSYLAPLFLGLSFITAPVGAVTYLSAGEFVGNSFPEMPKPSMFWLTADHQAAAREILGHPYASLRLRYWRAGERSAWIMDEIGKERPITIGVVIESGVVERVAILEYREPRGGEVRHPFFLEQFDGLQLTPRRDLDGHIDGITGATLSVRAVTNISRYALYLHGMLPGSTQ